MYFLSSEFHCKNPFLKKLQDTDAMKAIWAERAVGKEDEASLGKRLIKDYFNGNDIGLYARKKFQREKLEERFLNLESHEDHKELKERFQHTVVGKLSKITGNLAGWEEEEAEDVEGNEQYSDGVEETDYDNEQSDDENNFDEATYNSP